MTLKSHLL